jgi:phosphoadenosine phosphosulfate reductase
MPRSAAQRADLSAAWKNLHAIWKEPLESKIEHSRAEIERIIDKHRRPVVCWSGGKDSTALLHLVLEQAPHIDVIFNDPIVEFPETYSYIEKMANEWRLNLHITKPVEKEDFWTLGDTYGWPIFGKAVASNVERARRTGNLRRQLSEMELHLVQSGLCISCRCADMLRSKPGMLMEKRLECDLKIVGLRADESRARVRLWADYGEYYYTKRHFSHREGIWKFNPIARWREEDIWGYLEGHGIPSCGLYKMGHKRNGCWTCAMAIRNGQLKRLSTSHAALFEELLIESPMGNELMRVRDFWQGIEPKAHYSKDARRAIVGTYNDVFTSGWKKR